MQKATHYAIAAVFCSLVWINLLAVTALADCPSVRVADSSLTPSQVDQQIKSGEIVIDPEVKENFPDIEEVVKKLCQTTEQKEWQKHANHAQYAGEAIQSGGIYIEFAENNTPMSEVVRPDGSTMFTTAGNTPSRNRIQITPMAGSTDYQVAQTLVHEATHLGKKRVCRWYKPLTWDECFHTVTDWFDTNQTNVEENLPSDFFDGDVRWDYPIPKTLTDEHGVSRDEVQDLLKDELRGELVTLTGIVVDGESGEPIAGAVIDLTGATAGSATSGGDGRFSIDEIAMGIPLYATASAEEYQTRFLRFTINDANPNIKFSLNEQEEFGGVTLRGQIVDRDTGEPISNASVEINRYPISSDANGTFNEEGLQRDRVYTVSVSARGYETLTRPVKLSQNLTGIVFPLVPSIDDITISWSPSDPGVGQNVSVTISVSPPRALVPIRVSVTGTDGYLQNRILLTDATGSVRVGVPGAEKNVKDEIVAAVVGMDEVNARDRYVF